MTEREKFTNEISLLKELEEIPKLDKGSLKEYICEEYKESLNEMARINVDEFYGFFPCNKFEIKIWSNDHNPPHFHVFADGWDIVVGIEDGEIIKVKKNGNSSKIYSFVEKHIKEWLDSKCVLDKNRTNRENAWLTWKQEND